MANKFSLPGIDLVKGVGLGPLNIGNVLDTMDFVKKAWGAMNAPAAFVPTMDIEELDKRIAGLQSVEQWLTMNQSMIQGSIQALEVQRATIATLRGVTKGMVPSGFAVPSASDAAEALKKMAALTSAAPAALPKARKAVARTTSAKPKLATPEPGLSAGAWLDFLQGQFNQVAQVAMSGAALKGATQAAKDTMDKAVSAAQAVVPSATVKKARKPGATKSKK